MAQTFLVKSALKNANGVAYRIVKDRAWNDMPFKFLVQKLKMNYSLGKDRWSWVYTDKCDTQGEAEAIFARKIGNKMAKSA